MIGGRGDSFPASETGSREWLTTGRLAWLLGGFAAGLVLLTLADPGITVDEPLDVRPGRTYLATLRSQGWRFFDPAVIDAVFRDNAEHPPLGRWLLGIASTLGQPFEILLRGGPDPVGIYVVAGRVAPALAFGVLVGSIVLSAGRQSGRVAGVVAGLALLMMPRVFAHAHIAALDMFITLFWTLSLLGFLWASRQRRIGPAMIGAGMLWGLALLTKIHAWFVPPLVLFWALGRLPIRRAGVAMLIWLATGWAVLLLGWPWLWADPWGRLARYLGTGVARVSIRVLYFGTVYADRDVPWHYPWIYLLTTIPIGLLGLAGWGIVRGWSNPYLRATTRFWAGSILLFLGLFSTRIPVYDGERLFLVVFPAVAILIGQGFAFLWDRSRSRRRLILVGFFLAQATGTVWLHPFGLSYYNLLLGGLPGAERLGMELTYWGDPVDGVLLDRLAIDGRPGQTVALVPTLAPDQGKIATTRRLARIPLVIGDSDSAPTADWLVVSRRTAYWPPFLQERLDEDEWVEVRSRQGVWLAVLLKRRKPSPPSRLGASSYNIFSTHRK